MSPLETGPVQFSRGKLSASPFRGDFYAAERRPMPLFCEEDYAATLAFGDQWREPVHVTYSQHYALLDDVVRVAMALVPGLTACVLRYTSSYVIPLPGRLLEPDVFLTHDPHRIAAWLRSHHHGGVLVVDEQIRRCASDCGDNSICFAHYGDGTVDELRRVLAAMRLWQGFAESEFGDDMRGPAEVTDAGALVC